MLWRRVAARRPRGPRVTAVWRGVGARAIGVATGWHTVEQLEDAGGYAVFEDFADTEPVMEAIYA